MTGLFGSNSSHSSSEQGYNISPIVGVGLAAKYLLAGIGSRAIDKSFTYGNTSNFVEYGVDPVEVINGGDYLLKGDGSNNLLSGSWLNGNGAVGLIKAGPGDDKVNIDGAPTSKLGVFGGPGNDWIVGGTNVGSHLSSGGTGALANGGFSGSGFFKGGAGDDTFFNLGDGYIFGGGGADTFVLSGFDEWVPWSEQQAANIMDFDLRWDKVGLTAGLVFHDLEFSSQGQSTQVWDGSGNLLASLKGVGSGQLTEDHFVQTEVDSDHFAF